MLMCFGEYDFERKNIILYSALFIEKFDKTVKNEMIIQYAKEWNEQGITLLLNELVSGKACCHLEDDDRWNIIRNYYMFNLQK